MPSATWCGGPAAGAPAVRPTCVPRGSNTARAHSPAGPFLTAQCTTALHCAARGTDDDRGGIGVGPMMQQHAFPPQCPRGSMSGSAPAASQRKLQRFAPARAHEKREHGHADMVARACLAHVLQSRVTLPPDSDRPRGPGGACAPRYHGTASAAGCHAATHCAVTSSSSSSRH
jgi:hypothetical protein